MHRSSESIGTIAAALAKAQMELTNPEKSLIGAIGSSFRDNQRTFRYAPLSSGLDIVRKNLGRHEIATVQTTALNKETGLIHLTTMLVRIPMIVTTRSDASRPLIPIDRDQCDGTVRCIF